MVATGKPTSRGSNTCHFDLSCWGKMFPTHGYRHLIWSNEKRAPGWLDYMGVEPKIGGKPPKWMVFNAKPYQNG